MASQNNSSQSQPADSALLPLPVSLPAGVQRASSSSARPAIEIMRFKAMRSLRQLLASLCSKAGMEPPILAFDKWISRCMLPSTLAALTSLYCQRVAMRTNI